MYLVLSDKMYNGLFILVAFVNFIDTREITTISYNDRHNLAEKRLADVFQNEGAFVRHDVKQFIFKQRKFRLLMAYRLNSPPPLCSSKEMSKIV